MSLELIVCKYTIFYRRDEEKAWLFCHMGTKEFFFNSFNTKDLVRAKINM